MEQVMAKPKCRNPRCLTDLTRDEKRQCWVCLNCYPNALKVLPIPLTEMPEKTRLDVKTTKNDVIALIKELVPAIVRDELENWHIQKPSVIPEDAAEKMAEGAAKLLSQKPVTLTDIENKFIPAKDWRAQAKELGISLSQKTGGARKKIDVLADIAAHETV